MFCWIFRVVLVANGRYYNENVETAVTELASNGDLARKLRVSRHAAR
ncbi:MAG: hypothetical protein GY943_25290 [Chloroflexi bacterium]|nr:hypothetical protein [Chloroflexota bacterium]